MCIQNIESFTLLNKVILTFSTYYFSVGNNLKTKNFVTLIKVFLKRIPDLKDNTKCDE